MPQASLIDWDQLDLERTLRNKEDIQRVCKQRGRLGMLDGILHFDLEGALLVGYKDLGSSDWWCEDHIPGRPIFPGVLQLECAAQLSTYDFMHRRPDIAGQFVGFVGLNDVRFRGIVEPPARLIVAAKVSKVRPTMFTYRAQAFVERKLVLECEIMGMVL